MDLPAAIHITDEIDLTGIATALLACGTAALAWWTRSAVAQAGVEIERAHRPVLVPKIDSTKTFRPWGAHGEHPLAPVILDSTLFVPVRNVGMGPALRVSGRVDFGDIKGYPSAAGQATTEAGFTGVSHSEAWVALSFRRIPVAQPTGFRLTLRYEDVADLMWTTTARFSQEDQVFADITIDPVDRSDVSRGWLRRALARLR